MDDNLITYAAETPADLARLRAYVAECGQAALAALDRHLARPRYRPAFTRIQARAGAISGYALLGHERLRLGLATLEAGRIDALVVPLALPDQDAHAALLGDCLRVLAEEQLPLALLNGSVAQYSAFGFAEYRLSSVVEYGEHEQRDTLRLMREDDLDDLAALYEASYSQLPLTQIRTAPDWRHWLAGDHTLLGLEDSRGRLVAYAALAATTTGELRAILQVVEAAAADAGAARLLCAALLGRAQQAGYAKVGIKLSPWQLVAQAALQLRGTIALAAPPASRTQLAGVVDLPSMLEALAPEFERRLARSRYAGWSGNLRVEIATERITLALDAGRAIVIDGSRPADLRLRQVTLPALAQLCLGYRAAADLRATGELAYDDSALGLLDALFPVLMATE